MNTKNYQQLLGSSFITSVLIATLAIVTFWAFEPKVGFGQVSESFVIEQEITGEISFVVNPGNVQMNGSLNGMTGGTSIGSTTAVVKTNNSTGYTLEISFEDNGFGAAMVNPLAMSPDAITDHPNSGGEPMYDFNGGVPLTSAVFGYTVSSSESGDLDPSFLNNGSSCDTGSLYTPENCWMTPLTSNFTIIDRDYAAPQGATTTINFKVVVPNNPSLAVESGIYTATATLIATVK